MILINALCIYLIVLIIAFLMFYVVGCIKLWSSIALTIVISLIVLLFVYPPLLLITEIESWSVIMYGLIILISIIIIIFYIFSKGLLDKKEHEKGMFTYINDVVEDN